MNKPDIKQNIKPDVINDGECSLCRCKTKPSKGMTNFHQYTLWFEGDAYCDIPLCDGCLPAMIGTKGKERVLQKLKNTSYMNWGDKKLR